MARSIFELQFRGLKKMQRRLDDLVRRHPRVAQRALVSEAEIELTEMKRRTPVDPDGGGTLRSSGRLELVGAFGIKWVFGGAAIDYAVVQHEELEYLHTTGQAKYVESVVLEFIPNAVDRIGRRWAQELGLR